MLDVLLLPLCEDTAEIPGSPRERERESLLGNIEKYWEHLGTSC